jgi:hypothetical protein
VASSSLSRASQLIRGVGPTLGPASVHEEASGLRPNGRTTTARTTTHIPSHGLPWFSHPLHVRHAACLARSAFAERHCAMHECTHAAMHGCGRSLFSERKRSFRQITSGGRCPSTLSHQEGAPAWPLACEAVRTASCPESHGAHEHTNGRHHGNATDASRRGGAAQQADAADGARRFGVARFARQSSLMRAPQLIRGVRPTVEALAKVDG